MNFVMDGYQNVFPLLRNAGPCDVNPLNAKFIEPCFEWPDNDDMLLNEPS